MSDSRSSLELLRNAESFHPLAFQIQENIKILRRQNREIRLFWIRAHVGVEGNERADQLAKQAGQLKTKAHYDRCPPSFIKRGLRSKTINSWSETYSAGETGSGTKTFLPSAAAAYRIIGKMKLDPVLVQVLTGHGGFASYLYKFKCKDSPACICDPERDETVMHLLTECPQNSRERYDLETEIEIKLDSNTISEIMESKTKRPIFLSYCKKIALKAIKRNKS